MDVQDRDGPALEGLDLDGPALDGPATGLFAQTLGMSGKQSISVWQRKLLVPVYTAIAHQYPHP